MRLILFLIFLTVIPHNGASQSPDIRLLRNFNLQRSRNLDGTFKLITNSAEPLSIAIPASMLTIALINKDQDLLAKGIYTSASFLSTVIIATSLKSAVKRERPFVTYPDIERVARGTGYSFPSGHTSVAFSTATSLSISFPKWYVIAPSYLWAGLVGYSRMDLGVHYPSDVLAAAVIGTGSAFLCYKAQRWLCPKRKKLDTENSKP
jgi:membrane-associated phospholipid phosphatase